MLHLLREHGLWISKDLQAHSVIDTVKLLKHLLSEQFVVIVGCVLLLALEADLLSWIWRCLGLQHHIWIIFFKSVQIQMIICNWLIFALALWLLSQRLDVTREQVLWWLSKSAFLLCIQIGQTWLRNLTLREAHDILELTLVSEFLSSDLPFLFGLHQICQNRLDKVRTVRLSRHSSQFIDMSLPDHVLSTNQQLDSLKYFCVISLIDVLFLVHQTIVDDQVEWVLTFFSFLIELEVADVFKEADDDHAQDLFRANLASQMKRPVASTWFVWGGCDVLLSNWIAHPKSDRTWATLEELLDKVGLIPDYGQMKSWLSKLVPRIEVQLRWALERLTTQNVNAPAAPARRAAPCHQEVHRGLPRRREQAGISSMSCEQLSDFATQHRVVLLIIDMQCSFIFLILYICIESHF